MGTKLETKMEPNWTQIDTKLGTKMGPKWDQKGTKMGPQGNPMGSGNGPAPGAQKVSKVWNCRQKQAQLLSCRAPAPPDFGTPQGTL